jgi:GT2 family glycosyltransferase
MKAHIQTRTTDDSIIRAARSPVRANDDRLSVSVVIVHYGDDRHLERCLDSVVASAGVSTAIVVVDNCLRRDPEVRSRVAAARGTYLHYPENPGFAAGANAGLRCARARYESDVLVVLNSDLSLGRHCLGRLAECLGRDDGVGVVGPALLMASEPRRYWNVGTTISWPRGRPSSRHHGAPCRTGRLEPLDVDYICGAVLALRPEVLDRVGFLNEEYYLYYEDAEFSFRARAAGYRVIVLPTARAWHLGGGAFDGLRTRALYYRTRNRLLFSAAWNPCPLRGRWSRAVFVSRALLRAARQLVTGRRAEAMTLWHAVRDYHGGARGKSRHQRDSV